MLTAAEVLDLLPFRRPFRFVDRLLEVDENHSIGEYTYRHDEVFYGGHFPGYPVTPGVILIETMGQIAGSILMYSLAQEMSLDEVRKLGGVGTDVNVEFARVVLPGQLVRVKTEKIFWRGHKLKARAELTFDDGTPVCHGTIGAIAVASPAVLTERSLERAP
jgi:3-hydroxyacyl-[acyl-carrier-protein] dehydratase